MQTQTYNLPMLHQNQSMKEILVNDSLNKIDFLLNRAVIAKVDTLPPTPEEGDLYLQTDGSLALHVNNRWEFFTPKKNMVFFLVEEKKHVFFDGEAWI